MNKKGLTIIETLIGISFLAVIVGSILGIFIIAQRYFHDGIAMANSQATARIVIEKIVRPDVREGSSFSISSDGNTLTVTKYDGTISVFNFQDNNIRKNGNVIGNNIIKIEDEDIFEKKQENELVGIKFGVKNEGVYGHFQEVHIETQIKLRN